MQIEEVTTDNKGRILGLVEGGSLNEELVQRGLAWVYEEDCDRSICDSWQTLEENARDRGVGLWSRSDPTPPWKWR